MVAKSYVGMTLEQIEAYRKKKREAMRGKHKRTADLTPEQLEKRRANLREQQRRRRANSVINASVCAKRNAKYHADPQRIIEAQKRTAFAVSRLSAPSRVIGIREPEDFKARREMLYWLGRSKVRNRVVSFESVRPGVVMDLTACQTAYDDWFNSLDDPDSDEVLST